MIEKYKFGSIKINGKIFKQDIFVDLSGEARPWPRHQPHIFDQKDVESFLAIIPKTVIFGTGKYGVAKLTEKLTNFLKNCGVDLLAIPTDEAVKKYNQIKKQSGEVVAFFHLTC